MCTALLLSKKDNLFGRNMDIFLSFGESVIFVPRYYPIKFKKEQGIDTHFWIGGIGVVKENYPLLADAINEHGLAFCALSFEKNATYYPLYKTKENYAPYELPLYLLSCCKNLEEVKEKLLNINILNEHFSKDVLLTSLHYMFAYDNKSIVIESCRDGIFVYDNIYNVLTNNPRYECMLTHLNNYLNLSNEDPINNLNNSYFSYGLGAIGLPGDYSSVSRFVKMNFIKDNIVIDQKDNIIQFFHALDCVKMPYGVIKTTLGYEYTRYQCCYNLNERKLYLKKYEQIELKTFDFNCFKINDKKLIIKSI